MASPLWPARSTFSADTLKQIGTELTDLAPLFSAERTNPSVSHSLKWPGYFVRCGFNRPDPVTLSRPLGFVIQKSPKLCQ